MFKRALTTIVLATAAAALCGCPPKLDSPYFDKDFITVRNWNIRNGQAIAAFKKDSYRIAVIADSHANYDDLNKVIASINATPGIDFVVHLGDFTDRALPIEFSYFVELLSMLRVPSLVVMGNHDAIGFGPKLYERMFGPANFTVESEWLQLILLNANTLETGPIDYPWLDQQLSRGADDIEMRIIFRHTNHDNRIHHTEEDSNQFVELVEKHKVPLVLNGHRHSTASLQYTGWLVHQVDRVEGQAFSILNIDRQQAAVKTCEKGGCSDAKINFIMD